MSRNAIEGKYSGKPSAEFCKKYGLKTGHVRSTTYYYCVGVFCAMTCVELRLIK